MRSADSTNSELSPRIQVVILIIGLSAIALLIYGIGYFSPPSGPDEAASGGVTSNVVWDDVYDSIAKTQIDIKVVVSGKVTQSGLKQVFMDLYEKNRRRTGCSKYRKYPNSFFFRAFGSSDAANSYPGLPLAIFFKSADDSERNREPQIDIYNDRINALFEKPEISFGLSDAERRLIWSELSTVENESDELDAQLWQAAKKKDANTSDLIQAEVWRKNQLAKAKITQNHNISLEVLNSIQDEGIKKGWSTTGK